MKSSFSRSSWRGALAAAALAALFLSFSSPTASAFVGVGIHLDIPVGSPPAGGPPAPPPPTYNSPGPGAVWIDGHWEWEGHRWVWWPGYWEYPPRPEAVWVSPCWIDHEGHRYYRHGYWH